MICCIGGWRWWQKDSWSARVDERNSGGLTITLCFDTKASAPRILGIALLEVGFGDVFRCLLALFFHEDGGLLKYVAEYVTYVCATLDH